MSPTARSLAKLRKEGALAGVVERFNPGARVRQDLFGFIDIVALMPGKTGVVGIQACVTGHQSKRLAKIAQEPRAGRWLEHGNHILVWGWAKRGPRGQRKTWTLSETPFFGPVYSSSNEQVSTGLSTSGERLNGARRKGAQVALETDSK